MKRLFAFLLCLAIAALCLVEDVSDVWHVMKITSDYSECEGFHFENDRVNYIILFDAACGYFVNSRGTSDMETLEHIACEIEVCESATPYTSDPAMTESIGILEPGKGVMAHIAV